MTPRRARLAAILMALALVGGWAVWSARHTLLIALADRLVEEDQSMPSEIIVASTTAVRASALEAAILFRQTPAATVVVTSWEHDPLIDEVRRLGISYPTPTELACQILERSGVPPDKIRVLSDPVNGTESEVAAVGTFVEKSGIHSVTLVTSRSHTARAKWLLSRTVGNGTRVAVRASRFDEFSVAGWWRSRDQSRELVSEYLRWANSIFF